MTNKTDKGFQVSYWKLSYRRKFLRTLWMTPIIIAAIILIYFYNSNGLYLIVACLAFVSFIVQLAYNYIKWQAEKRNGDHNQTDDDIIYRP